MTGTSREIGRALRGIFMCLITAFVVSTVTSSAQAQTRDIMIGDGEVSSIIMPVNTTLTVRTNKPFADILIGNIDTLEVFPLTDTSLYVQGKRNGLTNITLYDEEKRLLEVIRVKIETDFSDQINLITNFMSAWLNLNTSIPRARYSQSNSSWLCSRSLDNCNS